MTTLMLAEIEASAANSVVLKTNGANKVTRTNGSSWQSNTTDYVGQTHSGFIKSVLVAQSSLSDANASLARRYLGVRDGISVTP